MMRTRRGLNRMTWEEQIAREEWVLSTYVSKYVTQKKKKNKKNR